MTRTAQSGARGKGIFGIQTAKGSPITSWSAPADTAGKFFPTLWPFSRDALGPQSELVVSDAIVGDRQPASRQGGLIWAEGARTFNLIPATMAYLLKMLMFPSTSPTGTDYAGFTNKEKELVATPVVGDNAITGATGTLSPPSKIEIAGTQTGTLTITGKRKIGPDKEIDESEVVAVTSTKRSSSKFFSAISNINLTTNLVGQRITANNEVKRYAWTFNTAGDVPYLTAQLTKGDVPQYVTDLQITNCVFTIAQILTATVTMVGKESLLNTRVPKTGTTLETSKTTLYDSADASAFASEYPAPADTFFQGRGTTLTFAGEKYGFTTITLTIDNQPDTGENVYRGSVYRDPPVFRSRATTLEPTIEFVSDAAAYNSKDNWDYLHLSGTEGALVSDSYLYLPSGEA